MAATKPKAVVKLNSRFRWYFQLRDGHGQEIHTSEDFPDKASAIDRRAEMILAIGSPRTTFVEDWMGQWSARLFSAKGRVLHQTAAQPSKEKARAKIASVIEAAKRAEFQTEDA